MIKNIVKLEHKVGERIYNFFCDHDAPLGEIHDALAKFKTHVISVIQAAEKKKEESQDSQTSPQG